MQIDICKTCSHCRWMVAIGLGVRCVVEANQKYKLTTNNTLPVIISRVPNDCTHYDKKTTLR